MNIKFEQTSIVERSVDANSLAALVAGTVHQLSTARTAAEILDSLNISKVNFAELKSAGRIIKAKGAHDEFLAKIHRAQADLLDAEASAKRRLADEYDAAQERGEVRGANTGRSASALEAPSVADIGLTHKDIHEARQFRDAETNDPGVTRRALDAKLKAGEEPTKAALREAVTEAAKVGSRSPAQSNKNPHYQAPTKAGEAWTKLYGTCRALSEWATDENMLLALHGHAERAYDQAANVTAIQKAAATLNKFLGDINAQ